MEIDFSKLPDKTEPKGIDLSGLPDKEINPSLVSTGPQWVQGKEPTLYEKVTNVFRDKPKEAARATLALVDSETLGINPGTAYSFKDALDKYYDIDPERKAKKQATLKAIQTFNDTGTEEGWNEAIWKNIKQVPLRIQASAGRIMQMLEETVTPETIKASLGGMSNDDAIEVFNRVARAREEKNVRSIGREFALEKEKQAAALMPNIMPGSFKDVVGSATQSALNNIIYLIPGMKLGRAIPLMAMGGQAFGESYGEQREAGQEPTKAAAASGVKMVSEIATEFIPTGKYLKPKISFVQRLVEAEFAEIPGESVNQIVNDVVDKVTIRPDMTVQDAIENIQKTIQVTALSTLGLSTGIHSVNKAIAKSMPDGPMKQTLNETVKDSLNRGATPQEALKAGIDAVNTIPEGKAFVEKKVEDIRQEFQQVISEAQEEQPDLDTDVISKFDALAQSEDEITDENIIQLLSDEQAPSTIDSDAVSEGDMGVTLEEGEKAQEGIETLDTVNPTGGISENYTPQERMTMKLGENITTLDKTMNKSPDKTITIYRGAPKTQTSINAGDYVTTNYQLAKDYSGTGHVISQEVKLSDILDDITEPLGEEYIYRPSQEDKQAQPQMTIADNLSILTNERGSIDLEPLIDIGRTIWNEGKRTYDEFVTRIKEIVGDMWEKVKPYLKEAWDAISNKHGSIVIKKRPLYDAVIKSGGLDPDKIKSSYNWKDDIQQHGLLGVMKKGGRALDDLATELQGLGYLDLTPDEYAGPGDYLLARLKEEKRTKIKESIKTLTEEEKQAIKELEGEWRNEGLTEDEIKRRFNEVQNNTQEEVNTTEDARQADEAESVLEEQSQQQKPAQSKARELKSVVPPSKVKGVVRKATGQVSLAKFVREDEALRAAFTKAAQAARVAFRAGNKEGVEEQKQIIRKILNRRALVKNVRDYFGLSTSAVI